MPKIKTTDGGTWRRLMVIDFKSKFVDDPRRANEFKRDPNLDKKMKKWHGPLLWMLVERYKKLAEKHLVITIPKSVLDASRAFRMQENPVADGAEIRAATGNFIWTDMQSQPVGALTAGRMVAEEAGPWPVPPTLGPWMEGAPGNRRP